MTFAEKILRFYQHLKIPEGLPTGVEVMNPYSNPDCMDVCRKFYGRFYNDDGKRHVILGINPGRYGAGITGIPFTDPLKLETLFGIPNDLPKKPELSAEFIHMMIAAFGGYGKFFSRFFINSISPLGFVEGGKNLNYYDRPLLKKAVEPFIRKSMASIVDLGVERRIVFCLGEGENFRFIQKMNGEERWFDEIVPLAHPRFIMQYKRKHVTQYVANYLGKLELAHRS